VRDFLGVSPFPAVIDSQKYSSMRKQAYPALLERFLAMLALLRMLFPVQVKQSLLLFGGFGVAFWWY
jgi:hypothetical protein